MIKRFNINFDRDKIFAFKSRFFCALCKKNLARFFNLTQFQLLCRHPGRGRCCSSSLCRSDGGRRLPPPPPTPRLPPPPPPAPAPLAIALSSMPKSATMDFGSVARRRGDQSGRSKRVIKKNIVGSHYLCSQARVTKSAFLVYLVFFFIFFNHGNVIEFSSCLLADHFHPVPSSSHQLPRRRRRRRRRRRFSEAVPTAQRRGPVRRGGNILGYTTDKFQLLMHN